MQLRYIINVMVIRLTPLYVSDLHHIVLSLFIFLLQYSHKHFIPYIMN